jgi:RHS repeat-associated protein
VIAEHDATTPYGNWGDPPYALRSARMDYIYAGSRMIYSRQWTSTTTYTERFYLSDRLSTRLVLDASGNVVGRQGHLPFGQDFAESGSQEKHHFTSYERDVETAIDQAVNRYDRFLLGRFDQADRLSGQADLPQSWNRYTYGRNDPINTTDPLGLFIFDCPSNRLLPWGVTFLLDGIELPQICFTIILPFFLIPREPPAPKPICTIQVFDRLIEAVHGIPVPGARHGYIVFTIGLAQFYFEGKNDKGMLTAVTHRTA